MNDSEVNEPRIVRIRHETHRRSLTVTSVGDITPNMKRIVLSGGDLENFVSVSPDDHVKVFVADTGGEEHRRDYTPRRYDHRSKTLTIDFALHDGGPVTRWAIGAKIGDQLSIGGPRGSASIEGVKKWILIGDETALPAIGRRIEESDSTVSITTLVSVVDQNEEQHFETDASLSMNWVHRPLGDASNPEYLLNSLTTLIEIERDTFVWVAAEASVTRAVRDHLLDRGVKLAWLKAAGYWVYGESDKTERF